MVKLNLGCGHDNKPGWVNIDESSNTRADKIHDLRKGIPYADGTVDLIYAEHFFEHLDRGSGVAFLRECHRALKPGGIVRLSMPDLREFVRLYRLGECALKTWECAGWLPGSPAQMMNEEFRSWGHQFIYDIEELALVFGEARGFQSLFVRDWGDSPHADLCHLETRPEEWNDLVVEGAKGVA